MIKIYLASRYSRREEMEGYARLLQNLGFEIASQWVWGDRSILGNPKDAKQFAVMDWTDVLRSDLVINFAEAKEVDYPRGSRHTEFGMAYQAGKVCYVVGRWGTELENIFHNLEGVIIFENWESTYAHLEQLLIFERARRIMLKISGLTGPSGAIGSNGLALCDGSMVSRGPYQIDDPGHSGRPVYLTPDTPLTS
jgi:hypothetical protein